MRPSLRPFNSRRRPLQLPHRQQAPRRRWRGQALSTGVAPRRWRTPDDTGVVRNAKPGEERAVAAFVQTSCLRSHWALSSRPKNGRMGPCCSRRQWAATSTWTTGGDESGIRLLTASALSDALHTRCGTRSPLSPSPQVPASSGSAATWGTQTSVRRCATTSGFSPRQKRALSTGWTQRSPDREARVSPACHRRTGSRPSMAQEWPNQAMELSGFEPLTSWVRSRRSPN